MPAGSSTGSVFSPTEPKGTEIFQVTEGSALDQELSAGDTVTLYGKKWQPYMVGSFPTLAAAKAASPPSGLSYAKVLIGAATSGAVGGATGLGAASPQLPANPLDYLKPIGTFFNSLGQAHTWIRVAEFLIGGALILVTLDKLLSGTTAGKQVHKVTTAALLA